MKACYVLIDYENVQPTSLSKFKEQGYKLRLFVGANQNKIPVDLAAQIQSFGNDAEYIRIEGTGKDALDFHIAFYMGRLSAQEPGSQFIVMSKDTGFDPLIRHLKTSNIKVTRSAPNQNSAPTKPSTCAQSSQAIEANFSTVLKHLNKAGKAKPAKRETLVTALMTVFQKKLPEPIINHLVDLLFARNLVSESNGKLSYQLNAHAMPSAVTAQLQTTKKLTATQQSEYLDPALLYLHKAGKAKPASLKSLHSALMSAFKKQLPNQTITAIIDALVQRKIVLNTKGKLIYQLNIAPAA
jgi:transcriptional regulator CtsR